MFYIYLTVLEKATWNWVENAAPEEKPLIAMVSGLMWRLASGDSVPGTEGKIIIQN